MKSLSHYNFIFYTLIILTVFQSVDAVADAVKFHQPNSQYSEADYFGANFSADTLWQNVNQVADNQETNDIDHCCYCHGVSSFLQTDNYLPFQAIKSSEIIISGRASYLSQLISPEHRPPIA